MARSFGTNLTRATVASLVALLLAVSLTVIGTASPAVAAGPCVVSGQATALCTGTVSPTAGTTATTFHFSVIYSDQYVPPPARPAPCVSVTITNTVTLAVTGPFTMTAPGGVPAIG